MCGTLALAPAYTRARTIRTQAYVRVGGEKEVGVGVGSGEVVGFQGMGR